MAGQGFIELPSQPYDNINNQGSLSQIGSGQVSITASSNQCDTLSLEGSECEHNETTQGTMSGSGKRSVPGTVHSTGHVPKETNLGGCWIKYGGFAHY